MAKKYHLKVSQLVVSLYMFGSWANNIGRDRRENMRYSTFNP